MCPPVRCNVYILRFLTARPYSVGLFVQHFNDGTGEMFELVGTATTGMTVRMRGPGVRIDDFDRGITVKVLVGWMLAGRAASVLNVCRRITPVEENIGDHGIQSLSQWIRTVIAAMRANNALYVTDSEQLERDLDRMEL